MEIDEFLSKLTLQEYLDLREKINNRLDAYLAIIYKDVAEQLDEIIDDLRQKGLELIIRVDETIIPVHSFTFDIRAKEN